MDYGAIFEEICEQLGEESVYTGNHPSDFATLTPEQQQVLLYWVQHVFHLGEYYNHWTSYGLKHDFEREGFYITNGQFKGAMLVCSYIPQDIHEMNWTFRIQPGLHRLEGFDKEYAKLLREAGYL